jgi:hypothetical protein
MTPLSNTAEEQLAVRDLGDWQATLKQEVEHYPGKRAALEALPVDTCPDNYDAQIASLDEFDMHAQQLLPFMEGSLSLSQVQVLNESIMACPQPVRQKLGTST